MNDKVNKTILTIIILENTILAVRKIEEWIKK